MRTEMNFLDLTHEDLLIHNPGQLLAVPAGSVSIHSDLICEREVLSQFKLCNRSEPEHRFIPKCWSLREFYPNFKRQQHNTAIAVHMVGSLDI